MGTPRKFLEPNWSIQRAGCYELLKIFKYTGQSNTTTYDCLCLRCGARHILERRFLMRLAGRLKARLGRKGIKYWLQVHGTCPKCSASRNVSPAPAGDCISKLMFFRHVLDAYGLRVQIFAGPSGVSVKIVDGHGDTATLEQVCEPRFSEPACLVHPDLQASSDVNDFLRAFLRWANARDHTMLRWNGGEFSLRYAGSFGGPSELRD